MKQKDKDDSLLIRDRLILFLKQIKENHEDFFIKTKLSKGFLKMKKSGINSDNLKIISEAYPELSLDWLIKGVGFPKRPFFGYSSLKIKYREKEQVAEISAQEIIASYEEMTKCLYLSLGDAQKIILLQQEKISLFEGKYGTIKV